MSRAGKNSGFTMIELMLAMAFVAVLLLAIAMTVIQMGNIYNRGLTIKKVNQAGRMIAADLQRNIASSDPFSVDTKVGDRYIGITVESYYVPQIINGAEYGGRLCLGLYSYIWNYGEYLNLNEKAAYLNKYKNSDEQIRFVKVYDSQAAYCENNGTEKIDVEQSIELLDTKEDNLALHSFKITSKDTDGDALTGQKLYRITYVIGTNETVAIDYDLGTDADAACKPPNQEGANQNYCSINQFSIVARSGGSVNSN